MSEWKKAKIGDFISVKHGYAFPGEGIIAEDNGVVLVTPGNFRVGGGFKDTGKKFFKGEYPADYVLKAGDFIVTMTDLSKESDTLGYSAIVPASSDYIYLHNQRIGLVEFHSTGIDRGFLYWLMRTKTYQHEIVAGASGTTVKHTSPSRIADVEISVPPLSTQKKIAAVLGALDDKIENNRKICKTLEEQAQAIFKSWFVDFDPFGGTMPKDWKMGKLGDVADLSWGDTATTKSSYVKDGYTAYSASGPDGYLEHADYDRVGVILSAIGASCGATWLARGQWSCIKNTIRFWSCVEAVSTEYLYLATENPDVWPKRGSAQPFISQTDARGVQVLIPDVERMQRFTNAVANCFELTWKAEQESRALAELRDALLPKLMSGEIDVEKVVV